MKSLEQLNAENDGLYRRASNFSSIGSGTDILAALLEVEEQLRALNALMLVRKYAKTIPWNLNLKEQSIDLDKLCDDLFSTFISGGFLELQKLAPKNHRKRRMLALRFVELGKDSFLPNLLAWYINPEPQRYANLAVRLCQAGKFREASAFMAVEMPAIPTEYSKTLLFEGKAEGAKQYRSLAELVFKNSGRIKNLTGEDITFFSLAAQLYQANARIATKLKKGHYFSYWLNSLSLKTIMLDLDKDLENADSRGHVLERQVNELSEQMELSACAAATWRRCYESIAEKCRQTVVWK